VDNRKGPCQLRPVRRQSGREVERRGKPSCKAQKNNSQQSWVGWTIFGTCLLLVVRRDEPHQPEHTPPGWPLQMLSVHPSMNHLWSVPFSTGDSLAGHCCWNPPAAPLPPALTPPLLAPFCPVGPVLFGIPP
jgi:hypothetical protein